MKYIEKYLAFMALPVKKVPDPWFRGTSLTGPLQGSRFSVASRQGPVCISTSFLTACYWDPSSFLRASRIRS